MTDIHSHILPGIDDGAKDVETSLEMLRESKKQGVKRMVATPHFYADHDTPERFLHRRERALAKLRESVDLTELPEIIPAAEVTYFEGMGDCRELLGMRIGNTKTILVEMPIIPWNARMIREVGKLYENFGLVPVIAHIDRYIEIFRDKKMTDWFEEIPVVIQANADFFINRKTAGSAVKLLKKGNIHLVGSDAHNMTTRKPNLAEAFNVIEKKAGKNVTEKIERMENALLSESRRYIFRELGLI